MTKITRTYLELCKKSSFLERYEYLRLSGYVGEQTFGFDRYLNQKLYSSSRWIKAREIVVIRDNGCDLSMPGYEIGGKVIIHHMNPITMEDFTNGNEDIYNPEFLVCVSENTHLAIHFGNASILPQDPIKRYPGDTIPWSINERRRS